MLDLYKNIKKYRLERGYTQTELADLTGYTDRSSIAKIESGDVDLPQSKIMLFAKALDVPPGILMGDSGIDYSSTIDFESYGLRPVRKKMIPVIGEVACGLPAEAIEIPIDIVDGEDYDVDYALKAKGDSMNGAEIYDGDIILIKTMPMVNNGEIAAVRIDGSTTLKYVYWYPEKKQLVLQAANPAYPPLSYEGEALRDAEILGKAVKLQRNI